MATIPTATAESSRRTTRPGLQVPESAEVQAHVDAVGRRVEKGFFKVRKPNVALLKAAWETQSGKKTSLSSVRSVYFALLEIADERDNRRVDSFERERKEIAADAGVSLDTLDRAVKTICDAGLLLVEGGRKHGIANRWTLLSGTAESGRSSSEGAALSGRSGVEGAAESGSTRGRQTSAFKTEDEKEENGTASPEGIEARKSTVASTAERFFDWHAERVRLKVGRRPARTRAALDAAVRILECGFDAGAIDARLSYALGDKFLATRVRDLETFDRSWADICLAFDAVRSKAEPANTNSWQPTSSDPEHVLVQ